ncbi:MAG: DUF3794 domain-containing protein [Clostridia bacterium]|nr:DUF3794 domain-containing protein [Clostridia bacterium]
MQENNANLLSIAQENPSVTEISEEFSLPDYVPEIRRVLTVLAQVLPESKYLQEGQNGPTLDLGGSVTYSLIYTDDEGKLNAIPLNSNYETKIQLQVSPQYTLVDTTVDNVSYRVSAPRRLTIKSRVKNKVTASVQNQVREDITPRSSADELYLEKKEKVVQSVDMTTGTLSNVRISDKLTTDKEKSIKPIWCDARLVIKDARVQNGFVSARGEAIVKCLALENEEINVIEKTMPIAEEIEIQGAKENGIARVGGRCVSLSISNEELNDTTQLFFDLVCDLEAEVYSNSDKVLTEDIYSTTNEMEVTYKQVPVYNVVRAGGTSFTFNESSKRKSKEMNEIIDVLVDPVCEKTEIKGDKMIASGRLNVNIIGTKENETEREYLCETYDLPLKYELDMKRQVEYGVARCLFSTLDANARFDKDSVSVTCEIYPSFTVFERTNERILDTGLIKKDAEIKKDGSTIRVYFPTEGDTLWEIAKKYNTTVSKIAQDNSIDPSTKTLAKNLIV